MIPRFARLSVLALALGVAGCKQPLQPAYEIPDEAASAPLPMAGAAAPRVNGPVGSTDATPATQLSYGSGPRGAAPRTPVGGGGGGDVSLDFADTDIREVVSQMLGTMLRANYTIDPSIHGTATLRTTTPIARSQILPTLDALLAQNGATVVQSGSLYRVVPIAAASIAMAGGDASAGSSIILLRYASADALARTLQPFVGSAGRVIPDSSRNAVVITGDASVRASISSLVQAFDIDILAGQSYALLPAESGDAKDFASALETALRSQSGAALAGQVRVVPMDRVNAVLVIASQPGYLNDARRIYSLVSAHRRDNVRSWHVYYLQNSNSNDAAYVLQQAFTPGSVTAQPSGTGQTAPGQKAQLVSGGGNQGGFGSGGLNSGGFGSGGIGSSGGGGGIGGGLGSGGGLSGGGVGGQTLSGALGGAGGQSSGGAAGGSAASANPLLGGLDQSAGAGNADVNSMRIIPNPQNNALLVYGTGHEADTVEAMLRKIDILPLQVRIDATIAEVTLNDALQYGTQFFFKSGGINGALNNISAAAGSFNGLTSLALGTSFPGFVIGGTGAGGAPFALSALQSVTTVHVLSSPQILVLDNQAARLQVGNLVPYLTTSSQSTITSGSPVINSIGYQPTGVIMQVTPRVNSSGLVTMDISQEVSDVSATANTSGISSPTFEERNVSSRVVVQDGQTIGLAGLIQDNITRGNSGIPWLKDIPILGALAGSQTNARTRTELLVLLTPHVMHDQRDARALTDDLREELSNAAAVPAETRRTRLSGHADPNKSIRRDLGASD